MYDLIILTTAIDRPELHSKTLKPFLDDLKKQNISFLWIVNLDVVSGNLKSSLDNFYDFEVDNMSFHVSESPCFKKASEYVIKSCKVHLDDLKDGGKVFWLEDDWDYNIKFDIKKLIYTNYEYIGFHFHHLFEFSLNPTMWSKDFFSNNVYQPFKENQELVDPEKLLIDYHKSRKIIDHNHFKSVNKIAFNGVFKDAGRKWIKDTRLVKWNKNTINSNISYA